MKENVSGRFFWTQCTVEWWHYADWWGLWRPLETRDQVEILQHVQLSQLSRMYEREVRDWPVVGELVFV